MSLFLQSRHNVQERREKPNENGETAKHAGQRGIDRQ